MRQIRPDAIAAAAERRFESEYRYAEFEYLRSAKVIEALERAGVSTGGRVLDAGCGSGGTALSLADESAFAVGLDLEARFQGSGTVLAREKHTRNIAFVQGDGARLPFRTGVFDLVFSHSVIEHVSSAADYLGERRRVLKDGGALYLSTAPYLSLSGAHLPRLRIPIPLHILVGRRLAFRIFRFLARRAPWTLKEAGSANSFVVLAEQGREKEDDLLQTVTVRGVRGWIARSGFALVREEHFVTGFFKRALPGPLLRMLARAPWAQDVMIGQMQYVLRK